MFLASSFGLLEVAATWGVNQHVCSCSVSQINKMKAKVPGFQFCDHFKNVIFISKLPYVMYLLLNLSLYGCPIDRTIGKDIPR